MPATNCKGYYLNPIFTICWALGANLVIGPPLTSESNKVMQSNYYWVSETSLSLKGQRLSQRGQIIDTLVWGSALVFWKIKAKMVSCINTNILKGYSIKFVPHVFLCVKCAMIKSKNSNSFKYFIYLMPKLCFLGRLTNFILV